MLLPAAISQSATSMPFDTTPVKTSLSRLPVKVKHKTDLHLFAPVCTHMLMHQIVFPISVAKLHSVAGEY